MFSIASTCKSREINCMHSHTRTWVGLTADTSRDLKSVLERALVSSISQQNRLRHQLQPCRAIVVSDLTVCLARHTPESTPW